MNKRKGVDKYKHKIVVPDKKKATERNYYQNDFVSEFTNRNTFTITFVLLLLITTIVFKDFIFLKKLFLYKDIGSDTLNGFYPFMKHIADYVHTEGFPKWSFNSGMGQNIFPFCLSQGPFSVLLYFVGKDYLPYCIGYVEFIKVVSGGLIFFLYLRTLSLSSYACIVGSLLFAFSGFMIIGGLYYIFSYEAVITALLLLAFEKLFKQNSWTLFPIVIALIGISFPFNLYVYGFFLTIYAIFRFVAEKGWDAKSFAGLFSELILLGLLGIALSSFFLFGNILQMLESPRGSGNTGYFKVLSSAPIFAFGDGIHNITAVTRFFSDDLLGTGSNFKGWNHHYLEAPMFYCGLITLLLFPLVFQFLDGKKKILCSLFLFFWIIPVVFPYARYAFWLFTGDYYRGLSFFVVFPMLFFGLNVLSKINETEKIKPLPLFVTLIVLIIILSVNYSGYFGSNNVLNINLSALIKALLVIYAVLIWMMSMPRFKSFTHISLITVLCIELGYFSFKSVNERSIVSTEEFKSKNGYNDYTVEAVAYIKSLDKSFYRIDKDYNSSPAKDPSLNDGLAQDYYGTSSYNSFNQQHYVLFLQAIGNSEKGLEWQSRWTRGLGGRLPVESIGSVKYFLSKNKYSPFSYDSIAQFGDVKVLRNRFYLPLGFTYEKFIVRSDYDKMATAQRDYIMMKSFFIDDKETNDYNGFERVSLKDTVPAYTWDMYLQDVNALRKDTLLITNFGQNLFQGKITLDKKKLLFLSIPYDKGWTATVDGKNQEMKIVDAGMSGLLLDKGAHTVELEFNPPLVKSGAMMSLSSMLIYGFLIFWKRNKKAKME
jgi:hypothetical protein